MLARSDGGQHVRAEEFRRRCGGLGGPGDARVTEPEPRPPGAGPETDVPAAHAPLVGAWRKTSSDACAETYPDEIEFFEHRFLGRKGPGQSFVRWDVGAYEVHGPDEIRIATATDERVAYEFSVEGNELTPVAAPAQRASPNCSPSADR